MSGKVRNAARVAVIGGVLAAGAFALPAAAPRIFTALRLTHSPADAEDLHVARHLDHALDLAVAARDGGVGRHSCGADLC